MTLKTFFVTHKRFGWEGMNPELTHGVNLALELLVLLHLLLVMLQLLLQLLQLVRVEACHLRLPVQLLQLLVHLGQLVLPLLLMVTWVERLLGQLVRGVDPFVVNTILPRYLCKVNLYCTSPLSLQL